MTILVTGAAGFIGYHTCLALINRGEQVVGIDNLNEYYDVDLKKARLKNLKKHKQFKFRKLDITKEDRVVKLIKDNKIKRVIHLAAQAGVRYSLEHPEAYINSNINGHFSILNACIKTGCEHLIYASSSSVYGNDTKSPFLEKNPTKHPISLYAATKLSDELMSDTYTHLHGLTQTGLRFFTVYGPYGRPDMAYYKFTKAICEDKEITVYNDGDMSRDFTYIDDIVDGIMLSLDNPPLGVLHSSGHQVFNLARGQSINLLEFVNVIERSLGKKAKIKFAPMQPGDVKDTYASIDKSVGWLGYNPQTSIYRGIPQFVSWYKSYYNL